MTTPEVESQWYDALLNGDCDRVHKLLGDHPCLLKVGWKQDLRRIAKARNWLGKEWTSRWLGDTALFEAALMGCVDLMRTVLRQCNVPTISSYSSAYEERLSSSSGEHAEGARKSDSADAGLVAKLRKAVRTVIISNRLGRVERKLTKESSQERASVSASPKLPPHARFDEAKKSGPELISSDLMSRKDLRDLLLVNNGRLRVDAITTAIINPQDEIVVSLVHAMGECENPLYDIKRTSLPPQVLNEEDTRQRALLRRATQDVLASVVDQSIVTSCKEKYLADKRFNHLPMEEYLFHYLCWRGWGAFKSVRRALWTKIRSFDNLWSFVLKLQDANGRTPIHVALIHEGGIDSFVNLLSDGGDEEKELIICAMTAPDGAGRTPVHAACGITPLRNAGTSATLKVLLAYADKYEEVAKTCLVPWQRKWPVSWRSGNPLPIDVNLCSTSNGLGYHHSPYTPVHAALIRKDFECAKLLIEHFPRADWGNMTYSYSYRSLPDVVVKLDTMELACLLGADASVIQLLLDAYLQTSKQFESQNVHDFHDYQLRKKPVKIRNHPWHALHLVAASGNYENLKLLLNDPRCNSSVEDFEGNTPLHHALTVQDFGFQTHLLDCIYTDDVQIYRASRINSKEQVLEAKNIMERQGCIELLLQAGCDIFKTNQLKKIPYPQGNLESNGNFMSWWYDKQSKELETIQKDCINATNAISITAALVAATSYMGPLQPPLNYNTDGIYDHNIWVVIFMVCDTMSFYFAIAAITVSLIPSLPMPRRAVKEKPHTTRDMVTLALILLFPSMVFVFIAFASSSIAVISFNVTSAGGWLTIATTLIGGLVCLLAFVLFSIKLLVYILADNTLIASVTNFQCFSFTKS